MTLKRRWGRPRNWYPDDLRPGTNANPKRWPREIVYALYRLSGNTRGVQMRDLALAHVADSVRNRSAERMQVVDIEHAIAHMQSNAQHHADDEQDAPSESDESDISFQDEGYADDEPSAGRALPQPELAPAPARTYTKSTNRPPARQSAARHLRHRLFSHKLALSQQTRRHQTQLARARQVATRRSTITTTNHLLLHRRVGALEGENANLRRRVADLVWHLRRLERQSVEAHLQHAELSGRHGVLARQAHAFAQQHHEVVRAGADALGGGQHAAFLAQQVADLQGAYAAAANEGRKVAGRLVEARGEGNALFVEHHAVRSRASALWELHERLRKEHAGLQGEYVALSREYVALSREVDAWQHAWEKQLGESEDALERAEEELERREVLGGALRDRGREEVEARMELLGAQVEVFRLQHRRDRRVVARMEERMRGREMFGEMLQGHRSEEDGRLIEELRRQVETLSLQREEDQGEMERLRTENGELREEVRNQGDFIDWICDPLLVGEDAETEVESAPSREEQGLEESEED